jgi:hypothetical protein
MALLGLTLTACPGVGPSPEPDYGVPETGVFEDSDGDGFSENEGDCDDSDDSIFPGATETEGDGIDSNCDGEDDT